VTGDRPTLVPAAGRRPPPASILNEGIGTRLFYALALVVAAAADLAAFYQIIAIATATEVWAIWLIIAGCTAMAVLLAHFVGTLLKDRIHDGGEGRPVLAYCALAVWVALGLTAFVVRIANTPEAAPDEKLPPTFPQALLFLALYLATGVVAIVGAYATRDRDRAALRRVRRAVERLESRSEKAVAEHTLAAHALAQRQAEHGRDAEKWKAAREERIALAEQYRHYASLHMAGLLKTPVTTENLTRPRPRRLRPDTDEEK
jgi:hypothetical protein